MAERLHRMKGNMDKFAAYKHAREGRKRDWKVDEDITLYDEVTKDQYKSIMRGRLQEDDFVIDDGLLIETCITAKKRTGDAVAKSKAKSKAPPPPVAQPLISVYRPAISAEQENDFMANLPEGIESNPSLAPKRTKKRKPLPSPDYDNVKPVIDSSPVLYRERKSSKNFNYDPYSSDGMPDDLGSSNPPSSDLISEDNIVHVLAEFAPLLKNLSAVLGARAQGDTKRGRRMTMQPITSKCATS
ncbi:hypothetical protein F5J12DRAFT_895752 [Pisolithus orientalis]|uniref:uncharacterized protein n=1 Tax=Pisolithus orientalis TaxID=936130 RepID=UPI002225B51A|nr:uncharacterized protein F5J12DRAFT_895752 [Pisolithus orientalis]KAI5997623.1 hypothetical protein F5J12DRAFT_895752 [Pisolithus orientalis]